MRCNVTKMRNEISTAGYTRRGPKSLSCRPQTKNKYFPPASTHTLLSISGTLDQACSAIAAVCLRNDDNCVEAVKQNAHNAIIKAMHMHPTSDKLQKNACRWGNRASASVSMRLLLVP